jgi:hypothetical protein
LLQAIFENSAGKDLWETQSSVGMAPSPLREAVVQGAALSVVSSVLAQMIEASQGDKVRDE